MSRPGKAGYSARQRAKELKYEQRHKALNWGTFAGGGTSVVAYAATWAPVGSLAAGVAVLGGLYAWQSRKPSGAERWLQGARAEERTARLLNPLAELGWSISHDRSIPRSKANLDHVAVHPSGRFLVYVDTKAWHAKGARIKWDGKSLKYGPWDQTKSLRTVEWEASRLSEEMGLPVVPVVCVDGGQVEGNRGRAGFIVADDTYVISSTLLFTTMALMDQSSGPNSAKVATVQTKIDSIFPAVR